MVMIMMMIVVIMVMVMMIMVIMVMKVIMMQSEYLSGSVLKILTFYMNNVH